MKQFQICCANNADIRKKLAAVKEACANHPYSKIIFYLTWTGSTHEDIMSAAAAIEEMFPGADYYGNEASGNISMGRLTYDISITCYMFEGKSTGTELVWVEKGTDLSSLDDLWKYCRTKKDLRAIELIPSIAYLEVLGIDRNVPDIDENILIFGGASVDYDDATFDADIIAKGHGLTRQGMAVMLYYGNDLSFFSSNILGWKGLGRVMEVTDSSGKMISSIDGVPAYSVYEKYLNLSVDDSDSLVFPLIVEEDGNEFIRTPQIILPDKSMLMFADISEGTKVRIAYGDKNTILSNIYDKTNEIAQFAPEAVKAFSCAARRLFWGDDDVYRETMPLQYIAPVCGFYTGGEILRFGNSLRVLNQTLAIVCMREGNVKGRKLGTAVRQNSDISLVSRLTYFTEKVVEEEKTQRLLAEGFESAFKSQYQVMYYINLDTGRTNLIHGDESAKRFLPIFNTTSPERMFENFHRMYVDLAVVEADRGKVKSVMNATNMYRVLKNSSAMSVNFRVRRHTNETVYTEMRLIKAGEENGRLTAVILAFKLTDEELLNALEVQAKLKEDARIIGALTENFTCVNYVEITEDKKKDTAVELRSSQMILKHIPGWEEETSFSKRIGLLIDGLVYEPDRKQLYDDTRRETIIRNLRNSDTYLINTRFLVDGQVKYYQLQFSAIRDRSRLLGIVAGIRSTDEQMRKEIEAQKRLEEALESAEVANRSKSTFLFNMSHDIRTPMNAIKGFTAMAKKYSDDSGKVKEYLDKIEISGHQLLTLINQVLEMSRIEAGKIELDAQPVNIAERFESMVTVVSAQARAKGLEFHYSLDDIEHFNVLADDSRMGQITINIVGNAIKYTPEGGRIDFRLKEIPARRKGFGTYTFTVEDTGIGMSEDYIKEIFEPFSREKTSTVSKIQGTGLGMSIVKNLVDVLGGEIKVKSEPGRGTRFDVTVDFMLDEKERTRQKTPEVINAVSFEGRRVLLVEDNEMNREIAKDILEEYGFLVEEADDGDIAVEKCRDLAKRGDYRYYDFILMDIQMPKMNGYEATKAIRAIPSPENTRVPIIAMTANAFDEDRQNAIAAGMDEHLAKPIDIQKLMDTLAKFL